MASRDLIQVNLYAAARAAAGTSSVQVPPGSLADVIERCSFLIDGLAVHGTPSDIEVTVGQQVDVLPPFAWG